MHRFVYGPGAVLGNPAGRADVQPSLTVTFSPTATSSPVRGVRTVFVGGGVIKGLQLSAFMSSNARMKKASPTERRGAVSLSSTNAVQRVGHGEGSGEGIRYSRMATQGNRFRAISRKIIARECLGVERFLPHARMNREASSWS